MDDQERTVRHDPTEREQVVGGILPDQEDAAGNFAQTDSAGGPGDRPVVHREFDQPDPAATASGGYGTGSETSREGAVSSGGSQSGGENAATGSATEVLRGEAPNDLRSPGDEGRGAGRPAADAAAMSDLEGE